MNLLNGKYRGQRGALMVELVVAVALLAGALLPIAYSLASEKRLARALYYRAAAMEIVDGELEILAAGDWRAYPTGTHAFTARGAAVTNLPPGRFLLKVTQEAVRLEWLPERDQHGGSVAREARLPRP
jgi:hypothetical protein